jgi:hypothetical protein
MVNGGGLFCSIAAKLSPLFLLRHELIALSFQSVKHAGAANNRGNETIVAGINSPASVTMFWFKNSAL